MRPGEHHPGRARASSRASLAELRHLTRTSITADLASVPDGLDALPGVHDVQVDGHRVQLEVDTTRLDPVLDALQTGGVRSLLSQPPTLEDLFLRHYGDRIETEEEAVVR